MGKRKPLAKKQQGETAPEGFSSICGVLVTALFMLTFIFQNFMIPSSSMASTLLVGDHVVVERMTLAPAAQWLPLMHYREPKRGDIVVFYKPAAENDGGHPYLVKRVVAIPGDRLHLRNGVVYLNGAAQVEPQAREPRGESYDAYINDFPSVNPGLERGVTPEWAASLPQQIDGGDLIVPAGKYFVMGDNRQNSLDSRYWGFVPRQNILGRPLFVYWSIAVPETGPEASPLAEQAESTLHELLHIFDETRWSRTFHRIQ